MRLPAVKSAFSNFQTYMNPRSRFFTKAIGKKMKHYETTLTAMKLIRFADSFIIP